jgi:hypothetical protein
MGFPSCVSEDWRFRPLDECNSGLCNDLAIRRRVNPPAYSCQVNLRARSQLVLALIGLAVDFLKHLQDLAGSLLICSSAPF